MLANGSAIQASDVADPGPGTAGEHPSGLPFPATIGELSRAAARLMLELTHGNKTDAARRLDISRPRLHRLLNASLNASLDDFADDDSGDADAQSD